MAKFRLVPAEGEDVLHRWPSLEECNLDDSRRDYDLPVTLNEAAGLVESGTVRACKHCRPLDPEG